MSDLSPVIERISENHIRLHPPQADAEKERIYRDIGESLSVIEREIGTLMQFVKRLRADVDKLAKG